MKINRLEEAKVIFEKSDALGKQLIQNDNCELVHLKIDAGAKIEKHSLPITAVFYVISGSGVVEAGGESYQVSAGMSFECKPGIERAWLNNTENALEILVIKLS